MGGDNAPAIVIDGLALSNIRHPDVCFMIFGRAEIITPLLEKYPKLLDKSKIIHTDSVVTMDDKPANVLRRGHDTSLWNAIGAVVEGRAEAVISAGNTGALMAMSKLRLRMIEGIDRPAIASIWPTLTGEVVVLDMGANIEAGSGQLVDFAMMGAEYARIIFNKTRPTVGLLNVGSEQAKGHDIVKMASLTLNERANDLSFDYYGFVEGNDITKGTTDVVVTDGFTGNIALKTAEGTAHLIGTYLKSALTADIWGKMGAWLARKNLKAFKEKIDPRRANGGVFLGLNGLVVKSHGGTNDFGFACATDLAIDLAKGKIVEAIQKNICEQQQIKG